MDFPPVILRASPSKIATTNCAIAHLDGSLDEHLDVELMMAVVLGGLLGCKKTR